MSGDKGDPRSAPWQVPGDCVSRRPRPGLSPPCSSGVWIHKGEQSGHITCLPARLQQLLASIQAAEGGPEETLGRKLSRAWPGWGRQPRAHSFTLSCVALLQGDELSSQASASSPCAMSAQGWRQVPRLPLTWTSETLALPGGGHTGWYTIAWKGSISDSSFVDLWLFLQPRAKLPITA